MEQNKDERQAEDHIERDKSIALEAMAKTYSESVANGHNYRDLECGFKAGYLQAKADLRPSASVETVARESALDPTYHCKSVTGGIALFMKGYNLAKADLHPPENIGQPKPSEDSRSKIQELLWVFSCDASADPKETTEEIIRLAQKSESKPVNKTDEGLVSKVEMFEFAKWASINGYRLFPFSELWHKLYDPTDSDYSDEILYNEFKNRKQ